MNSGLQKRLYEMEVPPPAAVWDKIAINLGEINTDNALAEKILDSEIDPPSQAWEKINSAININEQRPQQKATIINLKRLAAAAVFVGVVITTWVLLRNTNQRNDLAGVQQPAERSTTKDTGTAEKKLEAIKENDAPVTTSLPPEELQIQTAKHKEKKDARNNRRLVKPQLASAQFAVLENEIPHRKSFDQPIDDLSLVTADQHYMTMVNANGRLVKIPAQLAHLAPHLQDKAVSEDIYEVMFGEGTYWKETMNEWRRKVAAVPVSSGDAFTSFIELLKSVQDK